MRDMDRFNNKDDKEDDDSSEENVEDDITDRDLPKRVRQMSLIAKNRL